jgi:hypothetical protein
VILRIAAVVSLLMGAALTTAYFYVMGKGPLARPASRHLRAMKDRATTPSVYGPMTIDGIAALPRGESYAQYASLEARGVAVEGYVERMIRATDGDYHLDLSGPAGLKAPYLVVEVTPAFQRGSTRWAYESLVAALHPFSGGPTPWDGGPRRVRVSGWLLYDFQHEGMRPRLGFPPAVGSWEIHPVTRLEVWEPSVARFVEYPR